MQTPSLNLNDQELSHPEVVTAQADLKRYTARLYPNCTMMLYLRPSLLQSRELSHQSK